MTMTLEKVLYTGKAHTTGGRDGASRSSDGRLDIKLPSPGTPGNGTNPEQLFAAGWSACFMGAMGLAAAKMKTRLPARDAFGFDAAIPGRAGYAPQPPGCRRMDPFRGRAPRPLEAVRQFGPRAPIRDWCTRVGLILPRRKLQSHMTEKRREFYE